MPEGRRDARDRLESELLEVHIARVDRRSAARPRRVRPRWALGVLIVGLAVVGWTRATPRSHPASRVPLAARAPGAAGVAGAYGFPPRCLSITLAPGHPAYARADFDRRQLCGRYTGEPTAVFHRRAGAWRVVLDAVAYSCPVTALPAPVQWSLGICETAQPPANRPSPQRARGPRAG